MPSSTLTARNFSISLFSRMQHHLMKNECTVIVRTGASSSPSPPRCWNRRRMPPSSTAGWSLRGSIPRRCRVTLLMFAPYEKWSCLSSKALPAGRFWKAFVIGHEHKTTAHRTTAYCTNPCYCKGLPTGYGTKHGNCRSRLRQTTGRRRPPTVRYCTGREGPRIKVRGPARTPENTGSSYLLLYGRLRPCKSVLYCTVLFRSVSGRPRLTACSRVP